ncbi:hypothetical protein [Actinoalloteichus caeruleus]|uniref:hypothetical protein n=1 Tax=Actinoalloteichus cyanogriseus TaxID=2893586 RepID=UPI003BB89002
MVSFEHGVAARRASQVAVGTAVVVVLGLVWAGTASAHVPAWPEEVPAGGSGRVTFRVPDERPMRARWPSRCFSPRSTR